MTHRVFIALGSNLGNRIENLQLAVDNIAKKLGPVSSIASLYETEPWGFDSDNWFVNTVVEVITDLKPIDLLKTCLLIETNLGRKRNKTTGAYSSRIIDVDILFYDNEIIELPELIIPHKHLQNRMFVLKPLNDIAADFVHPRIKQKVKLLLENCNDQMKLLKIEQVLKP